MPAAQRDADAHAAWGAMPRDGTQLSAALLCSLNVAPAIPVSDTPCAAPRTRARTTIRKVCPRCQGTLVLGLVYLGAAPPAATGRRNQSARLYPRSAPTYDPTGCQQAGGARMSAAPPVGEERDKAEWPELLGRPAREARIVIETERPELTVQVVPPGSAATMDYRSDRGELGHKIARLGNHQQPRLVVGQQQWDKAVRGNPGPPKPGLHLSTSLPAQSHRAALVRAHPTWPNPCFLCSASVGGRGRKGGKGASCRLGCGCGLNR